MSRVFDISLLILAISTLLCSTVGAAGKSWQSLPKNLFDCLHKLGLTPITESSPDYNQLQLSWNHRIDVRPEAIVLPTSTESVAKAVQCSRAAGVKFSVRSGKHSYEGYGVQTDALLIDMSKMKTVAKVDENANEVWLDSGLILGEVYYYLSEWGKTLPGGTCGSVGMGGHVLGGGFGVRSRAYGLLVDHVVAIEIVSVDGEVLIADSNSHSDLFWALLGAGQGQFGVVTRFRFQTVEAKPAIEFSYQYPVESAAKALKFLQKFATDPKAPNEIWMMVSLVRSRDSVVFYGQYLGSRKDYNNIISSIGLKSTMGDPKTETVQELSYIQSILSLANIPITEPPSTLLTWDYMHTDFNWKAHSGFVKQVIPESRLDAVVASFYNRSAPEFNVWDAYILFDSWGGNIKNPSNARRSAFAHRDAIISVQSWVSWTTGDPIQNAIVDWQSQVWKVLNPNLSGAFVNYADGELTDYMDAYYPGRVNKLIEVKSKYDPDNIMYYAQSIPVNNSMTINDEGVTSNVKNAGSGMSVLAALGAAYLFH